jgi:transcriptional regulator with XRE-family HTH domain
MGGKEHVSERFRRMLALLRKPDGAEWGGQDLQNATGGAVTRSYVANLKNGRIENPSLAKLEAISGAMGFPACALVRGRRGERRHPGRRPAGRP